MRSILSLFIFLVVFFILPFQVLALAPPTQISPTNGSTVTSPTLEWQASSGPLYSTDPYKVQLADNPSFTSPKTPYYTSNTSYSPTTLSSATWYWKVNVRNSDGDWSGWSSVWSFTLSSSTPIPTETSTSSSSPTSNPSPSSSPTPLPTSSFTISNIPSQINSDQSFNAQVNLSSPDDPNTKFYLKGAFKKSDSSNYFGLTKVNDNWIKNGNGYSDQFSITTDSSENWSGNLEVKPDNSDSGFTGSGDYIFKVGKYNSEDSNPSVSWSNEITMQINGDPTTPSPSSKATPASSSSPTASRSPTPKPTPQLKASYRIASVAAAATTSAIFSPSPSPDVVVKNQTQINPLIWVGLILIFAGIFLIGYIYFRKNAKVHL